MMAVYRRGMMLLTLLMVAVGIAHAQAPVEVRFSAALEAFEAEDYKRAHDAFLALYHHQPEHYRTEAALLMAGKSLYRLQHYQQALTLLERFGTERPNSVHRAEAEQVMAYARLLKYAGQGNGVLRLGVALPLSIVDARATQALFSGIYVAVELHNRRRGVRPVQIIFRDTHASRNGAYAAVQNLVGQQVDAIIGPLYSDDVRRAAPVADQAGVVMMAPVANAVEVTGTWRHVFQASPTFEERGRFMARAAVRRLGYTKLGIVTAAEAGPAAAMVRGFDEERRALGAEVVFRHKLDSVFDWARISDLVSMDLLTGVEALYLPVRHESSAQEIRLVELMLTRLGSMPNAPHILGADSWRDVQVSASAKSLRISYAEVFHVREMQSSVRTFQHEFRALFPSGVQDHLAYVGFDVTSFLLEMAASAGELVEAIRRSPRYEGLGTRIEFDANRQNTALYLMHLNAQGGHLAR